MIFFLQNSILLITVQLAPGTLFFAACLLSFNYRRIYNIAPSAPRELAALDNDLEYRELEAVNERGYSSMMQVPIIVDGMINHHWSLEIYSSLRHRVSDSAN